MARIDARSGEVVIRIVYDGGSGAGKTANVDKLCSRIALQRSGLSRKSPGAQTERTEFFDWLEFAGGYVDGRRVRCQVLAVAGLPEYEPRRLRLLETADAIVFVVDSSEPATDEVARCLAQSRGLADTNGRSVRVGFILQANKQDVVGARSPSEVRASLGLSESTPTVASAALGGEGVMDTFVLAVRLATDRVRSLLLEDAISTLGPPDENPEQLYGALVGLAPLVQAPWPLRRNRIGSPNEVSLPRAQQIASGHIWPPVKGRATLSSATNAALVARPFVLPWAPDEAVELIAESGFVLHSTSRWTYPTEGEARLDLLTRARQLIPLGPLLFEARTLAVAEDGNVWRLWLVTPLVASLAEAAVTAVASNSPSVVSAFLGSMGAAHRWLGESGLLGRAFPAGAAGVAFEHGRVFALSLADEADRPGLESREPLADLAGLVARLVRAPSALAPWFEAEGAAMVERELGAKEQTHDATNS